MTFRDVKIKIPDRRMWMTSCTGIARRIWGDLKNSVSRVKNWTPNEKGRLSGLPDEFVRYGRCTRWCVCGGGEEKSQNRKNVYLSPYVVEPLNSKVIKSFVLELRSRKCFCVSGFLCSMYICCEHSMYVSHISNGYVTLTAKNIYEKLEIFNWNNYLKGWSHRSPTGPQIPKIDYSRKKNIAIAESARVEEYTDCISKEG